ncbi:MAG: polyphosphate:AMP phosphotransferase [Myxococcales bacterium]|nr:polyphosphate:AMP phosphotransferase [Polyangiaceae bacterium]MDW8249685.1 polyphosphate:AMP phosphotransferase [Myxococcales bacterium]
MFEAAELGHKIDKKRYEQEVPPLRAALLDAQYEMLERKKFPLIILISGVDGAGKGETVNLLNEWMDPRHVQVHAMGKPTDEEDDRPRMWRFWRALPPRGKTGIFFGSWYTDPIVHRVLNLSDDRTLDHQIGEILRFERMLHDEGVLVLKFWFHLGKKVQKKRLKTLEKDPRTRWRVTPQDWKNFERYDDFRTISERVLRETSTGAAPWQVVEGLDANYRNLTVGNAILSALRRRFAEEDRPPAERRRSTAAPAPLTPSIDQVHLLDKLDLSRKLDKDTYETKLEEQQGRLNLLTRHKNFRKRALICVFEGADAAGKGGSIRRITAALDARFYKVIPIAAPTEEEKAQPYLWRFWRHIPGHGNVLIFDRSWYGRVLVERVEGFCAEEDWMRAYGEINDFEEQLTQANMIVAKFWLQISKEEQLARFEERQAIDFKRFKITEEDWRNREKWDLYQIAASDMIERTNTKHAPWTLVEANDKRFTRIKILDTLCDRLEKAL